MYMSNITELFLPIVHTLKRTDYNHSLIQVIMVEVEMGRNVQVGMLSKLGINQVITRRYVTVVNSCANNFARSLGTGRFAPNTLSLWTFCPAPGRFAYSLAGPSREGDW